MGAHWKNTYLNLQVWLDSDPKYRHRNILSRRMAGSLFTAMWKINKWDKNKAVKRLIW